MRRPHWRMSPAEAVAYADRTVTHAQLVTQSRELLERLGWLVLVLPRGGFPGGAGWPDLVAYRAGRALFVEVKVGRDKASVAQLTVHASLQAQGFEVIEARSIDQVIEAAKSKVRQIGEYVFERDRPAGDPPLSRR